jgi:hypothetical protein
MGNTYNIQMERRNVFCEYTGYLFQEVSVGRWLQMQIALMKEHILDIAQIRRIIME